MQSEMAALSSVLVQDRICLVCRTERCNDEMFSGLIEKLVEEGRQAKVNIYEDSQKTVDVYSDVW